MPARPLAPGASSRALDLLNAWRREHAERPGDRLPSEPELARRLDVPRRALRRAAEVGIAMGELRRAPGGAWLEAAAPTAAAPTLLAPLAEVSEARMLLEPTLAALAAERSGPVEHARLRRIAMRAVSAGDLDALELWGAAFHRAVAAAARNGMLNAAFEALSIGREAAGRWPPGRRPFMPEEARRVAEEHAAIAEAIVAGEPDAAREAMRRHLSDQARRRVSVPGLRAAG